MLLYALTLRRDAKVVKWYDILPFILALPALLIAGFNYGQIEAYEAQGILDAEGTVVALFLSVALLWASWRVTSPALPLLLLAMMLAVYFQPYLPGLLHGRGYDLGRMGYAIFVGSEGVFGIPFNIACTILIMFIIFGQLFQQAGGGEWFLNLAAGLLGKAKGGPAKAAVMASFFFGTISGSPAANTATTGAITIPMMKKTGYSPALAGAIEATASTGGQIMPPVMGSIAFIMAEWLAIPYYQVVLAAAIPATMYFIMVFTGIHFESLKSNRPPLATERVASPLRVLVQGWFYIIPIVVLIVLLLVLRIDPALAGLGSVLAMIAASFLSRDKRHWLYPRKIVDGIVNGLGRWLTVAIITSAVGMIVGSLALSGLGLKFSAFIIDITGGQLLLILLAVAAGCFVLGMGLDSIPMYITMVLLTAPALLKIGIPDIAAHLFVIYWGMTSFITPPVCIAVYVACAISGSSIWPTGANAVRLGVGFYLIPFAFVLSPALVLIGAPSEIVIATIAALIGAVSFASGLMGFGLIKLNWALRVLHIAGGAMVIMPDWTFKLIGVVLIGLSLLYQVSAVRKKKSITA